MVMETFDFAALADNLTIEKILPLVSALVRVVIILFAALIASKVASRVISMLRSGIVERMKRHDHERAGEMEKRAATVSAILRKTAGTVIWLIAGVTALKEVGFDVAPILAGAGVIGLAVGFGAQNLVRDVITGLFMLMENQIRVNDVAVINGTGGLVEEINLRTTVLRGLDGTVHIFPNGTVTSLSNMTRDFSYYVFDIGVAYKEDTDRVIELLKEVTEEVRGDPQYGSKILEPLDVLGVDKFADSAVIIKVRIKTRPIAQWMVGREMNRRIKKKFDEAGVEIPFPHVSVYFGSASEPFKLRQEGGGAPDGLKDAVRAALQEIRAEEESAKS